MLGCPVARVPVAGSGGNPSYEDTRCDCSSSLTLLSQLWIAQNPGFLRFLQPAPADLPESLASGARAVSASLSPCSPKGRVSLPKGYTDVLLAAATSSKATTQQEGCSKLVTKSLGYSWPTRLAFYPRRLFHRPDPARN